MRNMMNRTEKRDWIRGLFLVLSPIGSSLLFLFIRSQQTIVGDEMNMYMSSKSAPLVYLFFGICLVLWVKLYEKHPNRLFGWILVIVQSVLFFTGCLHMIAIESALPAILIWIGTMITIILLS